jgi:two-component system cell cycle sensor histidine kinase/response regulator CckA
MITPNVDSSGESAPHTILVVEDNDILRSLIQRAVANAGYHALTAPDGRAARRTLAATPVNLVVTDVSMSDGDGMDLLMHLQTQRPQLPVIVMTSGFCSMRSSLLRAVELLPAGRTLEKPFSLQSLLDAVRDVIPCAARQ